MRETYIDPTAVVHPEAEIGTGTMIWNWTKVRERAKIGAGCTIGQLVYIDFEVVIGEGCKIQNGVSIYRGVELESKVFVGPSATFTNDLYPRADSDDWQLVRTYVEKGASIGANATIVCGVRLGACCMVGAGAVVIKDVPPHALVVGQPAKLIDYVTRSGRRLHLDLGSPAPTREQLMGR